MVERPTHPSRGSTPSVIVSDLDDVPIEVIGPSQDLDDSDPHKDLAQASGKNPSILLELDLDGNVRHLSKAWESVVGTRIAKIIDRPISNIILGSEEDKHVFVDATGIMMGDDESYRVRFVVSTNDALPDEEDIDQQASEGEETTAEGEHADSADTDSHSDAEEVGSTTGSTYSTEESGTDEESLSSLSTNGQVIELEGQGILIHNSKGIPTHSMWILKPFYANSLNVKLPSKLADSLGFGADIFASFLQSLSDYGIINEEDVPSPPHVLCRICEQPVPSWWLERHSQLCYNEHKCQSDVEMVHDMLIEQKKLIGVLTDSLHAQSSGSVGSVDNYKGEPLPHVSTIESNKSSSPISRKPRSGSIMRPLRFPFKTLSLLNELCETAIAINPSDFDEDTNTFTFSPNTKKALDEVDAYTIPSSSDPAISLLTEDTEKLVQEKVDAIDRLNSSLVYSQKIKDEVDELILQIITDTIRNIRNQTSDVKPPVSNRGPSVTSLDHSSDVSSQATNIAYPRPVSVHTNIFTDAYLGTDSLPSPTASHREDLSENKGRFSPARSITPGTEAVISDSSAVEQQVVFPGFSELHVKSPLLTPQRKPSPGIGQPFQNSPMSSIQRNSRTYPHDSMSGTPISSPLLLAHESVMMEKKGSYNEQLPVSSIKPPLSPLLVGMPVPKPVAPSIKDYEIVKPISKGAFGSVYLAIRKLTGEYFAIKVLKKSDMISKNQVTNVKAERAIMMAQSDSPYVAKLFSSFQSKDYLFLVMEYLPGGDCSTLVRMLGGLPEEWSRQYIAEVIAGVDDMHQKGIVHHDLKPDNLLIDSSGHLKLTDFGLSRMGLIRRQERIAGKGSVSEEAFGQSTMPTAHRQRSDSISALALSGSVSESASTSPNQSFFESIIKNEIRKGSGSSMFGSTPGSNHSSNPGSISATIPDTSGTVKPMHRSSSHTSFVIQDYETPSPASTGSKNFVLFDPENTSKNKKFVGTPDYLAPETIRGTGESAAADWWSVGCILFEFIFGYPPFHASTPEKVFQNILKGEIHWPELSAEEELKLCSPEAKDLISKLLTMDPEKRLGSNGAEEIKNHPYFKGVNWDDLWRAESGFVPMLDDPESTEYFESRGADMIEFPMDDEPSSSSEASRTDKVTLKKEHGGTTSQGSPSSANSPTMGKNHLSLAIPIHLRERRPSRLSDGSNEFGSFQFRNLPVLDKANKDVINRIKAEHMEHRSSFSSSSSDSRHHSMTSPSAFKRSSSPSIARSHSPGRVIAQHASVTQTPPPVALSSADDYPFYETSGRSTPSTDSGSPSTRAFSKPLTPNSGYGPGHSRGSRSGLFHKPMSEFSPSSSDNEDSRTSALERVRRRRQSSKMSERSGSKVHMLDVLLCESIPILRYSLKKDLESLGCAVVAVSAGDELIRRASGSVKFDLIITTLRVHRVEVVDIVKLLRHTSSVNSDTPVVAVTVYYKEAVSSGYFNDVLEKPVNKKQLQTVLEKYCHNHSHTEEAISDSESEAVPNSNKSHSSSDAHDNTVRKH
ncbi:protein kinase RIM15 CYBJADRAFT_165331 [Cyberlindnera jadinii NRRL Y-1542]|uniref:non-specific serine/threonine protein kinase n=1 Tax=Cyberlindnera jadinii (strain ATCC 18201 / CBS 1600 / BCRC 20928 / JCM 3617 / NBRC 0987 / NRRL Y-1542) TaxID=983966 RepID=A0A1E4S8Z4_CYBJN|nr:hypothetical protein CYBJADRAFT_165331 [Cyberlindnera jadinii NRRL Y-1542]ODV75954.1 hypothetical protein CYBJADRAFT_165331 [Cyberlindnera jadinii NRRL Y-1542]